MYDHVYAIHTIFTSFIVRRSRVLIHHRDSPTLSDYVRVRAEIRSPCSDTSLVTEVVYILVDVGALRF
jgi:hypothetical protein